MASSLPEGARKVVSDVCAFFADCFDNDEWGPFLGELTGFGPERVAGFLDLAVGQLSTYIPVPGLFSNRTAENFPYSNPGLAYALEISLEICVIEHLVRSYVEMPDTSRVGAPDVVRRDYMTRWQGLLNDLKDKLKRAGDKAALEEFDDEYAAGRYIRTLIDFPSVANAYIPFNTAERPQIAWWW